MNLSIIIVNYNSHVQLTDCLNSIFLYTDNIDFESIVIDNNSSDRGIEKLPELFDKTAFHFRNVNDGFGAGCNYGIKVARGEYIAIVNPDVIFKSNVFADMVGIMRKYPEIGLCSPVFISPEGELTFTYNKFPDFHWEFLEFSGLNGTNRETKKLLSALNKIDNKAIPFFVDTVTGACMLIRKEVLKKSGIFDENYFLYYEDTDLQKRITNSGFRIACVPDQKVIHLENTSTKQDKNDTSYYFHIFRSKLIYMKKHMKFCNRNLIRIMHIVGILFRLIALFIRIKFKGRKREKILLYYKILKVYLFNYSV